jgi:hypothetical protein
MRLDKAKIARATVRFLKQGGQGVVVPGGLIVTAAHVITWDGTGSMPQGERRLEEVEVGAGGGLFALGVIVLAVRRPNRDPVTPEEPPDVSEIPEFKWRKP